MITEPTTLDPTAEPAATPGGGDEEVKPLKGLNLGIADNKPFIGLGTITDIPVSAGRGLEGVVASLGNLAGDTFGADLRLNPAITTYTGAGDLLAGGVEGAAILALGPTALAGAAGSAVAEIAPNAIKAQKLAAFMTGGGALDFIMGNEGPAISHLLSQLPPGKLKDLGDLLASDADTPAFERRGRSILEGLFTGPVVGGVIHALGLGRELYKTRKGAKIQPTAAAAGETGAEAIAAARDVAKPQPRLPLPGEPPAEFLRRTQRSTAATAEAWTDELPKERALAIRTTEQGLMADATYSAREAAASAEIDRARSETQAQIERSVGVEPTQAADATRRAYSELEATLGPEAPIPQSIARRLQAEMRSRIATPEGARPIEDFIPTDETTVSQLREAVQRASTPEDAQAAIEATIFKVGKPGVERGAEVPATLQRFQRERGGVVGGEQPSFEASTGRPKQTLSEDVARVFDEPTAVRMEKNLRDFMFRVSPARVIPHRMEDLERVMAEVEVGHTTTHYYDGTKESLLGQRYIDNLLDTIGLKNPRVSLAEMKERAQAELSRLATMTGDSPELIAKARSLGTTGEKMEDATISMLIDRSRLQGQMRKTLAAADAALNPETGHGGDPMQALARLVVEQEHHVALAKSVREGGSWWGRAGVVAQKPGMLTEEEIASAMKTARPSEQRQLSTLDALRADQRGLDEILADPRAVKTIVEKAGGPKAVRRQAEGMLAKAALAASEDERAAAVREMAELGKKYKSLASMFGQLFRNQLIAAPRVWGKVFLSQTGVAAEIPTRDVIGSNVLRAIAYYGKRNPELAEEYARQSRIAARAGLFQFHPDTLKEVWQATRLAFSENRQRLFDEGESLLEQTGGARAPFNPQDVEAWRSTREALAPDWLKPVYSKGGLLSHAFRWLGHYGEALSYISSRPMGAVDAAAKEGMARSGARAIFDDMARAAYPDAPGLRNDLVKKKMDLFFHDGAIFSAERLEEQGKTLAKARGITDPLEQELEGAKYAGQVLAENPEMIDLSARLLSNAQEAAGTLPYARFDPLHPVRTLFGETAYQVDRVARAAGWPQFILPFVKTSYSLLTQAGQHVDVLGVLEAAKASFNPDRQRALASVGSRFAKDMLSGDRARESDAVGRLAIGTLAVGTASWYASQRDDDGLPLMTGALSRSPGLRELQGAKTQAYSIKIGDTWQSYLWAEPFSTLLGIASDIQTAATMNPQAREPVGIAAAMMLATAENVAQKSYLMGISTFLDALMSGDSKQLGRILRRTTVSATPIIGINMLGQSAQVAERAGNDGAMAMREVRSLADEYMSRIPYYRSNVPAHRNILGEPIANDRYLDNGLFLPTVYHNTNDDVVDTELVKLGHGFSDPNPVRPGTGMDLRATYRNGSDQDAYDRWLELTGKVVIGGRTLRQELRRLIKSPVYRNMPYESATGGDSPREREVSRQLTRYRTEAFTQLQHEYGQIRTAEQATVLRSIAQRHQSAQVSNTIPQPLQVSLR